MELYFQSWTEVWGGRRKGQRSTEGKRVKVSNAANILNKVRTGKSTGFGERTPVRNFSEVVELRWRSGN